MSKNEESSLREQFAYCENILEDMFQGHLGDSTSQQKNVCIFNQHYYKSSG